MPDAQDVLVAATLTARRLRERAESFIDVGRRAARDHRGRASSRYGHRAEVLNDAADTIDELITVKIAETRAWEVAACLKDRTRRAMRDRHAAGDSVASLADDYGVPERFVSSLVAWQLFADDSGRRTEGEQEPGVQALLDRAREFCADEFDREVRGEVAIAWLETATMLIRDLANCIEAEPTPAATAHDAPPVALHRAHRYIRELVALHRVRGPLTPTCETVCREADAFVTERA